MLISIFYVALCAATLPSAIADPWNELNKPAWLTKGKSSNVDFYSYYNGTINVLFLLEYDKDVSFKENNDKMKAATKKINYIYAYLHASRIKFNIEAIHEFKNTGKPLGDYSAKELKKLLKNDALFKGKTTARTDYTLVVGYGKTGHDKLVALTTFQSICSGKSRGIIIIRGKSDKGIKKLPFRFAKRFTYNLVCAAGLYDKTKCDPGFRYQDLATCKINNWPSKNLRRHQKATAYCFLGELGLYYPEDFFKKNRKICNKNRSVRRENEKRHKLPATESEEVSDDDEEGDMNMIVYLILAISGVVLLLTAVLGAWCWKCNKGNKLKKQVKHKYNSIHETR